MKILNCLFISLLLSASCNSQQSASSEINEKSEQKANPLSTNMETFFNLFPSFPDKEITCDDLLGTSSLGKAVVIEYINSEVRDWSDEDWSEMSYNAVMAEKTDDYYLVVIEKESPRNSQIFFNTYDKFGMRKSSILVCEDGPNGDSKSRIGLDRNIFRMSDDGVSTYKLNSRGVYVKGQ